MYTHPVEQPETVRFPAPVQNRWREFFKEYLRVEHFKEESGYTPD